MKSFEPFDCSHLEVVLPDLLAGRLGATALAAVEAHLADCPACRLQVDDARSLWSELGRWPDEEPSPELHHRFHDLLADEIAAEDQRRASTTRRPLRKGAYWGLAAAALLAGIAIGRELPERERSQIAALETQVEALTRRVAVSLLSQDSASERLRGAAFSRDAGRYDERIVTALLIAVRDDGNANVRLAAVDALGALLSDAPQGARSDVLHDLVASVPEQGSPVVQIALVDLLAAPGAASRSDLEGLLATPLDPTAKSRLRRHLDRKS